MSYANRGKYAEGQVWKILKANTSADSVWARWPDARAGSWTPAPADYIGCIQGQTVLLEVKEVKHRYRLPYKNFPADQLARLRLWRFAGAKAYTIVYFSEAKEWFMASVDWWFANKVDTSASWNTEGLPKFTTKEVKEKLKEFL